MPPDATTVTAGKVAASSGGGDDPPLGACTLVVENVTTATGSQFYCSATYACDAGQLSFFCEETPSGEQCSCHLDTDPTSVTSGAGEAFQGTCTNEDPQGCGMPDNCCFAYFGGAS